MYERYSWEEPRIHVNQSHHYWRGTSNDESNSHGGHVQGKRTIRMFGGFVENCLWTPKLSFLGAVEDSASTSTSNMEPYLGFDPRHGHHPMIVLSSLQMKININCNMRFDNFPFDAQVGQL